jgi:hypothetical protein
MNLHCCSSRWIDIISFHGQTTRGRMRLCLDLDGISFLQRRLPHSGISRAIGGRGAGAGVELG